MAKAQDKVYPYQVLAYEYDDDGNATNVVFGPVIILARGEEQAKLIAAQQLTAQDMNYTMLVAIPFGPASW